MEFTLLLMTVLGGSMLLITVLFCLIYALPKSAENYVEWKKTGNTKRLKTSILLGVLGVFILFFILFEVLLFQYARMVK